MSNTTNTTRAETENRFLAVAMTSFNSMRTITSAVKSLEGLADRVFVVDSGSTDGTVQACRDLGCEVIHRDWTGYADQKRFGLELADGYDWVMILDSDEAVEPELARSIRALRDRDMDQVDGLEVNRRIVFQGQRLKYMFQPEWRLRIVRPGKARIEGRIHEQVIVDGRVGRLDGDLLHDSWVDVADMLQRGIDYSREAALAGSRGGHAWNLVVSPPSTFIKQYLLKRGLLDGRTGLLLSGCMAAGTLIKHLTLMQHRRDGRGKGRG